MTTSRRRIVTLVCLGILLLGVPLAAHAAAIRPGFNATADGRNDDGTWTAPSGCTNPSPAGTCAGTLVPLGFTANFFGLPFTSAFINTNGNITFDSKLSTFTPFNLTSTSRQIIAPYFADVDTRIAGDTVKFGPGTVGGRPAFGVDWINVDYFSSSLTHTNRNSFQLLLVDRSDLGAGNFDIEFNYDQIQWEAGTASGGNASGLGGSCARAGFSNGTGAAGTSLELAGSAVCGSLLDNAASGLIHHSLNSDVLGRYDFFARNGTITTTPPETPVTPGVPEPASLLLLASGLVAVAGVRRWLNR